MAEQNTYSVPKFSSFKPKASAESRDDNAGEERKTGSRDMRDVSDSANRSRERSRSKGPDRKRRRDESERHSSGRHERREYRHRSRSRSRERRRHHDDVKSDRHERHHHRHRSRSRSRERTKRHDDGLSLYESNHHHNRHRSRPKSPARELVRRNRSPTPPPPWSTIDTGPSTYIIDRKGDENNLRYNCIHRYDIPRFRRFGYGCVLGLNRRYRIQRSGLGDVDAIVVSSESSEPKQREKYVFAQNEKKGVRLLRIRENAVTEGDLDGNPDFVPLKREKVIGSEERSDDEFAPSACRLIESSGRDMSKPEDDDLEYAPDSGPEDDDLARKFRKADLAARERLRHATERDDTK